MHKVFCVNVIGTSCFTQGQGGNDGFNFLHAWRMVKLPEAPPPQCMRIPLRWYHESPHESSHSGGRKGSQSSSPIVKFIVLIPVSIKQEQSGWLRDVAPCFTDLPKEFLGVSTVEFLKELIPVVLFVYYLQLPKRALSFLVLSDCRVRAVPRQPSPKPGFIGQLGSSVSTAQFHSPFWF